jgi:hypothetical protein
MKILNQKIDSFEISDDRESITFHLGNGETAKANCYADCCSETWIESLDNEDALIGGTVRKVEDIEMPHLGDVPTPHHEYADCIAYYGLRIETDKGVCVIDYRNDSNGYYGGSLDWED